MSTFDDASLVFIPSGYKNQKLYSVKPLSGDGDLTFSRASSATRVASNGLIEKVRTNLALQSNTFSNASWIKTDISVTSGQAGYDGTTNAWLVANTAASGNLTQTISFSGFNTLSFYAKAGTHNYIFLLLNGGGFNATAVYNLSTGAITDASGDALITTATSVGNGWWRITITGSRSNSDFRIYPTNTNGAATTNGNILVQNVQLEAGDIATAYIATTSAAVSVGPVSGLPRLDYLNSTCPRLLLEPQRSSLVLYSEQMDNASWIKLNGAVTANAAVSPDGYTNADKFVPNATLGLHALRSNNFNQSATASHSWFVKADGYSKIAVRESDLPTNNYASFNLSTGTLISTSQTGSIVDYGNGWYRCTLVDTNTGASAQTAIFVLPDSYTTGDPLVNWSGDGTKGVLAYGVQVELGAYATSYIPTLGTSVTRVADAASKTSASALIGQTEGTIFAEVDFDAAVNTEGYIIRIDESSFNDTIFVSRGDDKILNGSLRAGGSTIVQLQKTAFNGVNKLAFAYKSGSFALYVNGTQVATSAATYTNGITYDDIRIGGFNATTANMCGGIKQLLLFTTRLSNSDLAALTA